MKKIRLLALFQNMFKLAHHWFVGKVRREPEEVEAKNDYPEFPPSEWLEKINNSDVPRWVSSAERGSGLLKEFSKPAGLTKKRRDSMPSFEINDPLAAGQESIIDESYFLTEDRIKHHTKVSNPVKREREVRSAIDNNSMQFIKQKKRATHNYERLQVPFKDYKKIKSLQGQFTNEGSWEDQKDLLNSKESTEIINPDEVTRQRFLRKETNGEITFSESKQHKAQAKVNPQKLADPELKSLLRERYIESNYEGLSKRGAPETKIEKVAPGFKHSSLFRFVPEDNGTWPALPQRNKASSENNNGIAILREQNRLQLLEKEQRVMPWIV